MTKVSIKDIAKNAGVSIATVSRVVNENYYVSPEIKEKVLRSIDELHYYPNTIARSLKNNVTYTIGFVVSDIGNSYFTAVAKALEGIVNTEKYNIIVCSTDGVAEREKEYLDLLMGKKIDGLVINTTGKNDDLVAHISKQIATVLINRKIDNSSFIGDFVDSNNYEGGYDLANHLLSLGHRKIAVINGDLSLSTGKERFEGFNKALHEHGILLPKTYQYDGDFTIKTGFNGIENLLNLPDRPTAVVAMNNMITIGALKYLISHRIKVPDDISIAAYGNIDNIELLYITPSYVTLNPLIIGKKAGQLLLERIKDMKTRNRETIFTPQLIPGNGVKEC